MSKMHATDKAPAAIGPYSQAVVAGNMIYVSGQLPLDPKTMDFVSDEIQEQTRQSLINLKAILESAGYQMEEIVKTTIYIKDMNEFSQMNDIYSEFFQEHKPARACVEVARLPKDARVEIEAVAMKE